jgi:hypothetical protein
MPSKIFRSATQFLEKEICIQLLAGSQDELTIKYEDSKYPKNLNPLKKD